MSTDDVRSKITSEQKGKGTIASLSAKDYVEMSRMQGKPTSELFREHLLRSRNVKI